MQTSSYQRLNTRLKTYFSELNHSDLLAHLSELQREFRPELSFKQAQEHVIWTLVERHNDQILNFLWQDYKHAHELAAAA